MGLQKRLEYGFNGYQVPPTPRAARSATRRVPFWKKTEDDNNNNNSNSNNNININNNSNGNNGNSNKQMCAFELLATEAGKLLQEGGDKINGEETKVVKHSVIKTAEQAVEDDPSNVNICDQGSCNRSFFVSEIISQAPIIDEFKDTYSGPSSGITVSDSSEKVKVKVKASDPFSCKVEENKNSKPITKEALKPPVVHNIDNNVNLVVRDDDDENSFGVSRDPNKTFKSPSRIGDRRIRRFLASKYWKSSPKLNDEVNSDADVYRNRKPCYKRPRSLKDYPLKKRRLYELDHYSNSDDVVNSEDRSSQPQKESIETGSGSSMKTSGFLSKQNPVFQTRDSHVKLKIKSFRVPELFFELPKTTTVGSLKRTVMEAVTSTLSGELHVGVMLQGKKIKDDDKTLLQTGIHNKLDALGFTLEPNKLRVQSSFTPKDQLSPLTPDMPKPVIRYTPVPLSNQLVEPREGPVSVSVSDASLDLPLTNFGNLIESDHDSAPSPPKMSLENNNNNNKSGSDLRALVTVHNPRALSTVPMRKSKRSVVAQRRIRRPFSVSEVEALVQAVEKLGTGRWRDVKLRAFDNAKHRTYVDLKDKWKTLVHTARISPQQRRGEPVPQELLDRVLAAHAYWSHHQAKQQFKQPETCRLF